MDGKILNLEQLKHLEEQLASINSYMVKSEIEISNIINSFDSESIVQQFYASGKYGSDVKERLEQIRIVMNQYYKLVSDGPDSLVSQTKKYVSNQIELQTRNARGYSVKESIAQRREGNQG